MGRDASPPSPSGILGCARINGKERQREMFSGWVLPQISRLLAFPLLVPQGSRSEGASQRLLAASHARMHICMRAVMFEPGKSLGAFGTLPLCPSSSRGCVDMDISELLISQRECHRAPLVLMFILGIPHSRKCQFMQRGASVCTALGCRAWRLACHASKMWLKSLSAAVFWLNEKETLFLAEIFICYESQSSSLKWSGNNVFVLL